MITKIRAFLLTVSLSVLVFALASAIGNGDYLIDNAKATATSASTKDYTDQSRFALVIGNSEYNIENGRLRNAANDAKAIAAALNNLGFKVTLLTDIKTKQDFEQAAEQFIAQLSGEDIALFFYSGHGVQGSDGANYLIPTQANIDSAYQIQYKALNVQYVIDGMEKRANFNLVVLDACRDNPFPNASKGASKGLGRMNAPNDMLIAYATAPNQTADDGNGTHSPYAQAFLDGLDTAAQLPITEFLNQIGVNVLANTDGKQSPKVESSPLHYNYCFRHCNTVASNPAATATATCPDILLNIQEIEINSSKIIQRQAILSQNREILNLFKEGDDSKKRYRKYIEKDEKLIAAKKQEIAVQLQSIHNAYKKNNECIKKQLTQEEKRLQDNASLKAAQTTIALLKNTVAEIPTNSAVADDYFSELVKNYNFN